jgi:hypothetical protein
VSRLRAVADQPLFVSLPCTIPCVDMAWGDRANVGWRRAAWTLMAALAGSLAAFAPGASAKPPAPQLAITAGQLEGKPYVFYAESAEAVRNSITITDTTTNRGKARSAKSVTKVVLIHGDNELILARRSVPALRPGQSDTGQETVVPDYRFPLGSYKVFLCANAGGKTIEQSNCRRMLPRYFFVIAAAWRGSLGGRESFGGSAGESWSAPNAELKFDQYEGGGVVTYLFHGTVGWIDSGIDAGGCTWSGAGTRTYNGDDSIGDLQVQYLRMSFIGSLGLGRPFYRINVSCPGQGTGHEPGPFHPEFWATSSEGQQTRLPFGAIFLPGSPTSGLMGTWTWRLERSGP